MIDSHLTILTCTPPCLLLYRNELLESVKRLTSVNPVRLFDFTFEY